MFTFKFRIPFWPRKDANTGSGKRRALSCDSGVSDLKPLPSGSPCSVKESSGKEISASPPRRSPAASEGPAREVVSSPSLAGSVDYGTRLDARRAEEREYIRRNDSEDAKMWYLVDVNWLQAWKDFVTKHSPPPGPVDNGRLVDRYGRPVPGLAPVADYRGVNGTIWHYWVSKYGGGPCIRREQLNLYAEDVPEDNGLYGQDLQPLHLPGAAPAYRIPSNHSGRGGSDSYYDPPKDTVSQRSGASSSSKAGGKASTFGAERWDGGQSMGARSSSSHRGRSVPPSRGPAARKDVDGKALCCDKCDGPHATDDCPHFSKPREKHPDAWSCYGKAKSSQDTGGDGAPLVRNARVITQPGDGSCLFHSLSYGLNDGHNASTLRREICSYLQTHPEVTIGDTKLKDWIEWDSDSRETVQSYAQRMSSGSWGGGIEMAALTKMKNINVHVYEKCADGFRRISCFETPGAQKTISVLYKGRMHYDAIVI